MSTAVTTPYLEKRLQMASWEGLRFRVQGYGLRVWGCGFRVECSFEGPEEVKALPGISLSLISLCSIPPTSTLSTEAASDDLGLTLAPYFIGIGFWG